MTAYPGLTRMLYNCTMATVGVKGFNTEWAYTFRRPTFRQHCLYLRWRSIRNKGRIESLWQWHHTNHGNHVNISFNVYSWMRDAIASKTSVYRGKVICCRRSSLLQLQQLSCLCEVIRTDVVARENDDKLFVKSTFRFYSIISPDCYRIWGNRNLS